MRRVEDLSDDELVEAVAAFGMNGLNTATPFLEDEDPCLEMAVSLGVLDGEEHSTSEEVADVEVNVVEDLINRLTTLAEAEEHIEGVGDTWIRITAQEWGRRLAGKTAEEIESLLRGES